MKSIVNLSAILAAMFLMSPLAWADTPAGIDARHGHGVSVSGKITRFRVQEPGVEIGQGEDKMDAEVLVQIEGQPEMVYGLRLHEDSPAHREMIETMRQAYLNDKPVTLEHRMAPGKKHVKITWIELAR